VGQQQATRLSKAMITIQKKNGRRPALPSDFLKELISMLQLEMSKIPGAQDWADGRR